MRFSKGKRIASLVAVLVASAPQARATVVVSNLADPIGGDASVYQLPSGSNFEAQEFLTGAGSFQLGSIILPLNYDALYGPGTPLAELVSDNAGLPGSSILTTFNSAPVTSISPSFGNVVLTPNASVTLTANTHYWLIVSEPFSSTYFRWAGTHTLDPSITSSAHSADLGASWTTPSWTSGEFLMEVDSAPTVPLPGALPLLVSGLLGFLGVGARARRATA